MGVDASRLEVDEPRRVRAWWFVVGAIVLVLVPLGASRLFDQPAGVAHTFEIPPGTADRIAAGEDVDVLPENLSFKVRDRLVVTNHDDEVHYVGAFYGQSAADALLKLLAGHWGAVRDFNTATVARSKSGQDNAVANLTSNAREIARLLSGANPNLPEDAVFGLLIAHGGHHVAQSRQIASADFKDEAATWHAMRKHVMEIADAIADAVRSLGA